MLEEKPDSFLAFSLFSAFAGGHLGAVLLEMLINFLTQVGVAGVEAFGDRRGTVGFFPCSKPCGRMVLSA